MARIITEGDDPVEKPFGSVEYILHSFIVYRNHGIAGEKFRFRMIYKQVKRDAIMDQNF